MAAMPDFCKRCIIWFGHPGGSERDALAAAGWRLRAVAPGDAAGIGLRGDDTVVGMVDLRDGATDGLAQVEQLLGDHRYLPLVAMTSARTPTREPRVQRLLRSCVDTFAMPLDLPRVLRTLDGLGGEACRAHGGIDALIGQSPALCATRASVRKLAPVDLPVLITGQTGTGKEVAAHALHDLSPRRQRPFAAINCGALPPNLVQSELFGHERGAFTGASARRLGLFESAAGGSVFLDEIGDLPLDVQTNLLRVLQEGTIERVGSHQPVQVDVRIIAATHVDLERAVEHGRFRSDLYYRLNVLRLHMPPLHERGGDIELLAQHFLQAFRSRHATRARGFSHAARAAMATFAWPGNVRELLNRVQRAAVVAEDELISPVELELSAPSGDGHAPLDTARAQAERDALLRCLHESAFNVSACARRMQLSRVTVYRMCRRHGVALEKMRE
ncbi:sigma-54-dependent Fis family transcriptional regulator [Xanthomonas sp. AmX2]|uniref:sigma-54 interaction domain-containing protein n=1 Tax=Xanthomonas sp. TaxID=29446 RepID=UPI00198062B8|nr:sigma-54 dependent transcriptional regulator [Xanthomonas sp.]MBN6149635.1 sigma-54-dependent Fis family transcriptional regulator [Xanthomonas sp.]